MKAKAFNHTGVIDLKKAKNSSHSGAVILSPYTVYNSMDVADGPLKIEIKHVKMLTTDMIKSIDFNFKFNGLCDLKINLNNKHSIYYEHLEYHEDYKLSVPVKLMIGRKIFGKTFDKLSKFSNTREYLTALCNLYDIADNFPNVLEYIIPTDYGIIYNQYDKSIELVANMRQLTHNCEIIAFSPFVEKMIKLKRVLDTLKSFTYSRQEVIDIIIKADKF